MPSKNTTVMPRHSLISFEVLSSMVEDLVDHYDRSCDIASHALDWESPTASTKIVRYGSSMNLHSMLNQVADSIVAEYQLRYRQTILYTWKDYRWPHLLDARTVRPTLDNIIVPDECLNELLTYHQNANTCWYNRYQAMLSRDSAA